MARSLRAHLLRLLLPPIAALLAVGAVVAYYPSMEPATAAYNQALVDVGIALGSYVRNADTGYSFDLPPAVEQVLRTDRYDTIYYRVITPEGRNIAGEPDLPMPPDATNGSYEAQFKGQRVHVVSVQSPCGSSACNILVAETTVKRTRLTREILFSSLMPQMVLAVATLVIVWFGVKRGLGPLARLSEEIKGRSPRDLHPIDAAAAPEETRPLLAALNGLLEQVSEASRNQQRFLANAAHQL
ncbi:MAG TPA: sensor histidine kinase N-terminal domain-containing protein, partial [Burkholderiales bacterium]|nr:sensor histidine kinase N-terminal domain-containing protein [Burkholderiales bacterium]